MAKSGYVPKKLDENICMVMLPTTLLGKATRASIQSLIIQLRQCSALDYITDIRLDNSKLLIKLGAHGDLNKNDFMTQLKQLEHELSNHSEEKASITLKGNLLLLCVSS